MSITVSAAIFSSRRFDLERTILKQLERLRFFGFECRWRWNTGGGSEDLVVEDRRYEIN